MFNPNVAQIIIQYLEPLCLEFFFKKYELNKRMKFTYNSAYWGMRCESLQNILEEFTNMTLKGVMLENSGFLMDKYFNRFDKVVYCGLYDECEKNIRYFDLLHLINWNIDVKVWNIVISRHMFVAVKLCKLSECLVIGKSVKNLDKIKVIELNGKMGGKGLKKVVVRDGIKMYGIDFFELASCSELTHLDLDVKISHPYALNCIKLKCFKIKNNDIKNLNILYGCKNLEKLVVRDCAKLKSLKMLKIMCPNIKYVKIIRCHNLMDLSVLDGIKNDVIV